MWYAVGILEEKTIDAQLTCKEYEEEGTHSMPRNHYVHQLETLREDLLRLGSRVEHAILNAVRSLEQWDTVAAAQVIHDDNEIDNAHRATEKQVIKLIAAQSSDQDDPRLLVAAFAIAGELERIGDYACSIARRVGRMTRQPTLVPPPPALNEMTMLAQKILNISLESFLRQDADMAYGLQHLEERVDVLEDRLRMELIDMAHADPQRIESVVDMLDIVHAIERVSDRATNIGERVIYLTTSMTEELNP
jgi:phosphate transport system protein